MTKIAAIIVAAGTGERFKSNLPKQYLTYEGDAILCKTLNAFLNHPDIDYVLPIIHHEHKEFYHQFCSHLNTLPPVNGGQTRQESVFKGLKALLPYDIDYVLIHDAARPFVTHALIDRVIKGLSPMRGCIPILLPTDTIKVIHQKNVQSTLDRNSLGCAQTPQGFPFSLIYNIHEKNSNNLCFTDDSSLCEHEGVNVLAVDGDPLNMKITYPSDIHSHYKIPDIRVGQGFDVHAFEPGDSVWLCGIKISCPYKLKGHSDADVALHALTDALLAATGEGDIGQHFPPHDVKWKGVSSHIFVEHAYNLIQKKSGTLNFVDITIIGEKPKISPYRDELKRKVAEILNLTLEKVSIKATTTEKLGFCGREEGLAAMATATVIF